MRVCYCSLHPSSVWSNSNTHSETFASFRFKQKHVSDWQGKMAWPRVRILGKHGQFIECRKRSLPSSPTAWVTCHGALESLGWPHGQNMNKVWRKNIAYPCNPIPTIYIIFIWETHGFWHIQRSMVQSSDAPSGSANDEIQRPPMVLPRCFQGVRWVGEMVRSQETRTIYCQTYPKMNSSCMIMWLLHVTLHVHYIESWIHVSYIYHCLVVGL